MELLLLNTHGPVDLVTICFGHKVQFQQGIASFPHQYLMIVSRNTCNMDSDARGVVISPLLITFPSTYHSPRTVKRKAMVFTIGTVKLSSTKKTD